ncbi:hypothetical protein ACERII_12415 [Evansella sp. AB-rgal1]|uniref:hypothetical protein n=1 Tax=Evansella sp. AB-rgal1 TaxID=3242696 RepID=UPI00359CFC34
MIKQHNVYWIQILPLLLGGSALLFSEWDTLLASIYLTINGLLFLLTIYSYMTYRHNDPRWYALILVVNGNAAAFFTFMSSWRLLGETLLVGGIYFFIYIVSLIIVHVHNEKVANAIFGLSKKGKWFLWITLGALCISPSTYAGARALSGIGGSIVSIIYSISFFAIAIFFIAVFHSLTVKMRKPNWRVQGDTKDIDLED